MRNQSSANWGLPFRYTVGIILFIGFIALLIYAREAVKMLIIAAFTAYLINPAVTWLMHKTKLSRTAAVNIVYFSSLIVLIGAPAVLTPIFFEDIKTVANDILKLSQDASQALSQPIQVGNTVLHLERLADSLSHVQDTALAPLPAEALALLESTSLSVLWLLVILVTIYLFLSYWPQIRQYMIEFGPPEYHEDMRELYKRIRRVWMAYLRGQIVLMIIVGVVFTIAWFIIGIPGALVLGVVAGLFTLVPDVGPTAAALLAVGVALLEGSSWDPNLPTYWVAVIAFVTYLILISMKNFFLRPFIMGRSVHMNEGLVFISIMIATLLEGILGALLVVPVLASFVVIFEYLRRRVVGLPPFDDDGVNQFVIPPEQIKMPRRLAANKQEKRKKES